ncbi:Putative phage tail protein [Pseudosulfitobacter pseudonitzschiae]|uniref:Tip attachment protein J domain-containing protein n=1 Tax=Pseudosulfitobacter pseudonitzschiae TaxID=1402135 RepID=A0A073IX13_9RHOB|nr:phage tail protein [Pseudosulfitobacter pseudonitzschiae]KEJ93991.1 hypothetical protein SUH3_12025 [Pseudosulfitobacter pseudonitzschiae]SHG01873.1 Putative phage tail protein [Pseudosulfitobacter pseudonitzschiae]
MAIFTAIAAAITAISSWTIGLGALGSFAIGNFLLRAAVQLGVSALARAFAGKPQAEPFSIQGSIQTGGSVPRSFVLGPSLSAGSLAWHSEWGDVGGTPNAYYTQVIALSDLPVAGLRRWFIEGRAVSLEDTGDEKGLAAVEYRENGKDHAWLRFHDGNQTAADEFLTGTVSQTAPRVYSPSRIGFGVAYVVVTFRVNQEIFTGFPRSKFVLDGVKLYDISKDGSQGGVGLQRWDEPATWGGDGDALPAVQAYNLARGFRYGSPALGGGFEAAGRVSLGSGVSTLSLELIGGGGGGMTDEAGTDTVATLKDGAAVVQVWTASGGAARSALDHNGGVSPRSPFGDGAEGQKYIQASGKGENGGQPLIRGGASGVVVVVSDFDISGLSDPILEIEIGAGATDARDGVALYSAGFEAGSRAASWFYGLQGLTAARLPAAHWISQVEKCRAEIQGEDGLEPIYRAAGEITVNSEIGAAFEALLTACAGRMSEVGGIFKIYVGGPDAPVAHFTDLDIVSLSPQSFTPFYGLSDTVNGVIASYPSPDEGYVMRSTPPLYNPAFEVEDGGRRLMADVQLPFVPFPAQAQRLLVGELAAARRARRHTHTLPARFRLIEPGDVVTWTSARNGYEAKQFRVDGIIDLPNCDLIVDVTEVDPADHGNWDHASDFVPVTPSPLPPVLPSAQSVVGFDPIAADVGDGTGAARRPGLLMRWDGGVDDVAGILFEVSVATTHEVVAQVETRAFEVGVLPVVSGLLPATIYEVRAKYIPASPRAVSWTPSVLVSTNGVYLGVDDLDGPVQDTLKNADEVRGDHDALVDGFVGKLSDAFDGVDTAIDAMGADVSSIVSQVTGLLPSGFGGGAQYWQEASGALAPQAANTPYPISYDAALSANAIELSASNKNVATKGIVEVQSDRVYEIEVKGRVTNDGTKGPIFHYLGISTWDSSGVALLTNFQFKLDDVSVADGVFHLTMIVAGEGSAAYPAGSAGINMPTGTAVFRPHYRVNGGNNSDATVKISMLAVREVTGISKADSVKATLETQYLTSEGVNGAIAAMQTLLQAGIDDNADDIGSISATLTSEYLTKADTESAIAAVQTLLQAGIDGNADDIGQVSATLTSDYLTKVDTESAIAAARLSLSSAFSKSQGVLIDQFLTDALGWNRYAAEGVLTKAANEIFDEGETWGFDLTAVQRDGLASGTGTGAWSGQRNALGYVVECDFTLVSGTLTGAGLYLAWKNTGGQTWASFKEMQDCLSGPVVLGQRATARVLLKRPSAFTGTFDLHVFHAFANWNGFPAMAAKNIKFHRVNIRVATAEELAQEQIQDDVADVAADLAVNHYTKAATDSAIAAATTDLSVDISNLQGNITDILGLEANFTNGTIFGTMLTELGVMANGVPSVVTAQGTAIADLEGNASAGYLIKAQAGDEVSLLELIAADGSEGSVSIAKISAASILLDGSVTAAHVSVSSFAAAGLAVFGGTLRSSTFNGAINGSGAITDPGSQGWAITKEGNAAFTNLISRSDLVVGSVSDGSALLLYATPVVKLHFERATANSLGVWTQDNFWTLAWAASYRHYESRSVYSGGKGDITTYYTDRTSVIFRYRLKIAGVWGAWVNYSQSGWSASFTTWQTHTATEVLLGNYDDVELDVLIAHNEISQPSNPSYWGGSAFTQPNIKDVALIGKAIAR